MDEPQDAQALHKRWTGGELLLCVVIQLVLVNVAYRIDRRQQAPLLSTSAWSIFFGLLVRPCRVMYDQRPRPNASDNSVNSAAGPWRSSRRR